MLTFKLSNYPKYLLVLAVSALVTMGVVYLAIPVNSLTATQKLTCATVVVGTYCAICIFVYEIFSGNFKKIVLSKEFPDFGNKILFIQAMTTIVLFGLFKLLGFL